MCTNSIYFYKEVDTLACNLKTRKLLDCALIGVCAVIGSNMVSLDGLNKHNQVIHSSDYFKVKL